MLQTELITAIGRMLCTASSWDLVPRCRA